MNHLLKYNILLFALFPPSWKCPTFFLSLLKPGMGLWFSKAFRKEPPGDWFTSDLGRAQLSPRSPVLWAASCWAQEVTDFPPHMSSPSPGAQPLPTARSQCPAHTHPWASKRFLLPTRARLLHPPARCLSSSMGAAGGASGVRSTGPSPGEPSGCLGNFVESVMS